MTVKSNAAVISARIRRAAMTGLVRGTESVLEEATSLILDGEKTGRVYRRRGVEHQASAPGQAPASDMGRLVQSGHTSYDQNATVLDQDSIGNLIGRSVILGLAQWSTGYAHVLEHGTEMIEARPFARPALASRKDEILADIVREIEAALR